MGDDDQDSDEATGDVSSEETQTMPTDEQKEEWEKGEEEGPLDDEDEEE